MISSDQEIIKKLNKELYYLRKNRRDGKNLGSALVAKEDNKGIHSLMNDNCQQCKKLEQ